MTDKSVMVDVGSKCPKCSHQYLARMSFTRKRLIALLKQIRMEEVKRKVKKK